MMYFRDAYRLALTKFKIRKFRTFNTALLSAMVLSIILTGVIAYSGVKDSISEAVPAGYQDKFLAFDIYYNAMLTFTEDSVEVGAEQGLDLPTSESSEEYSSRIQKFNPIASFEVWETFQPLALDQASYQGCNIKDDLESSGTEFTPESVPFATGGCYTSVIAPKALYEPLINNSFTQDGVQQVIVSTAFASTQSGIMLDDKDTPKQRVEKLAKIKSAVEGRKIEVWLTDKDGSELQDEVVIVGVMPESNLLMELAGSIPPEFQNASLTFIEGDSLPGVMADIENASNITPKKHYVTEFSDESDLITYLDSSCEAKGFDGCFRGEPSAATYALFNYSIPFERTAKSAWSFFKYVVGFLALMAALNIYGTLSKIMSESARETGVFRAIGARREQIAQIYAIYTTMIVTAAYLVAMVLAIAMNSYLTLKFGGNFDTQIAALTGSLETSRQFSFIGFNWLWIGAIYLIAIMVGFLGALVPLVRSLRRDPISYLRQD